MDPSIPGPGGRTAETSARLVRAVFGATGIVRFGFGLTLSIFTAYLTGHTSGLTTAEVATVGLVSGMAPIGEFSTVIGSGILADRRGRLPVLLTGMGGGALLLVLISFTRDPYLLGSLNFGFGVASGAILAASLAVLSDQSATDARGLEMGRFDAANLFGWIAGFAVGFGILGTVPNGTLPWVFRVGAAALGVGLLIAVRAFGTGPSEAPGAGQDLRKLLGTIADRDVLLVIVPWFAIYLLLGTVFVFLSSASAGIGVPPLWLAGIIGGGGLLLVITQPAFGHLADLHGRTRLMVIGAAGFVGVLGGAGGLATFGYSIPLLALVGASALAALAYGPAALASLVDLSKRISRGTTMAVYTLTISFGMWAGLGVSTGLYGRFGALGLDLFFGLIAVILTACTILRYLDVRGGRVVDGTVGGRA